MSETATVETSNLTRDEIWSKIDALIALGVSVTKATAQFHVHRDSYYKRKRDKQDSSQTEKASPASEALLPSSPEGSNVTTNSIVHQEPSTTALKGT